MSTEKETNAKKAKGKKVKQEVEEPMAAVVKTEIAADVKPAKEPVADAGVNEGDLAALKKLKEPKSVKVARQQLAEKQVDLSSLTAEQLKEQLPQSTLKQLYSCLSSTLKTHAPSLHEKYLAAMSDAERRLWLTRFIIDPNSGGCSGSTKTTVKSETKKLTHEGWITKTQMAGPNYAGSPEHAEIYSTFLPSKPHDHEAFRKLNVMLYWWSAESIQKCDGKSESTEVVSAAEMSSSAYDQVRQAMLDTA
ncbi:unnamed protein product, partial [Prorocentrum cordatum]